MVSYRLRILLPDRPGALGLVASRIGAVGGDIVAIDIVRREAGRAVDDFVVELSDEKLLDLLCSEILEVDGVTVKDIGTIEPVPAPADD